LFFSGSESDNYLEMEGIGKLYGVVEKRGEQVKRSEL
jgi:hypothetical protein